LLKLFRRTAHAVSVVAPLLIAGAALAQPAPQVVPQSKDDAAKYERKTDQDIQRLTSALGALREKQAVIEARQTDKKSDYWPPVWSNWCLFVAAAAAAYYAARSLGAIKDEVAETKKAADAAADSAKAAADTLATNQEIERAYIAMSYRDLLFLRRECMTPVRPSDNHPNPDTLDLVIELKNLGRTPGDVVGGWCGFLYQEAISETPKLLPALDSSTRLTPVFLMPNHAPMDFALQITLRQHRLLFLRDGELGTGEVVVQGNDLSKWHLWLAGEIDYRDRFDRFHRAGYATRWDRHAYRFVWDPSVANLNYDRPLTDAEIKQRAYKGQKPHEDS
jgi:hypothetical protein